MALRDIRRGEEVTYDYKYPFFFTRQAQEAVAAAEQEVRDRAEERGIVSGRAGRSPGSGS